MLKTIVRINHVLISYVLKQIARSASRFGSNVRFLSGAKVQNIHGDRYRISLGDNVRIRGELTVFAHDGRIKIGDWFYMGPGSTIWSSDPGGVTIGDRVLISYNVAIHDTNSHPMSPDARFQQTKHMFLKGHDRNQKGINSEPITIGDDVWIGMNVVIMKGVTVGNKAIIGAGAIVLGDVPPNSTVPPGTVIKKNKVV